MLKNKAANYGGAMHVINGNVTLGGNLTVENNTAKLGGGISADKSHH